MTPGWLKGAVAWVRRHRRPIAAIVGAAAGAACPVLGGDVVICQALAAAIRGVMGG